MKKTSVNELMKEVKGLKVQLRGQRKRIEELEEWIAATEESVDEGHEGEAKQPSFAIEIDSGGGGMFIGMN